MNNGGIEMNGQNMLGPYIKVEDLKKLPLERMKKYLRERLEDRINKIQIEFYEMFCNGSDEYGDILYRFNEYSSESSEMKDLMLKNEKIVEIMETILHVVASENYASVSEIEEINKGLKIVFGSDFGQEPWRAILLAVVSNNAVYMDQVDSLATFFKELDIPEEEIKSALSKALKNMEAQSKGFSIEALMIRKKHGIEIEPGRVESLKEMADQAFKHLMFQRAVELYEALIELDCDIGVERNSVVSVYRSNRDDSQKDKLIKNIGVELGLISRPKETEEAKVLETKHVEINEKRPWWKLW